MFYATITLPFLFLGEIGAQNYFTNLRTRCTRDRKKLQKVSSSGSDDVAKVKDEVLGDVFVPVLA